MKYLVFIASMILFVPCSVSDSLSVICSGSFAYTGNNGEEAVATSYLLSDSTLYFVKLLLNGVDHTMPRTVSGSGVRYSDGMNLTWWEHSDSAMVQHRDSLGNWETAVVLQIK